MIFAFILAALVSAIPSQTFNEGILRVERFGNTDARPIVFVPGLACGPWVWNAQISALAPTHDVYVVSLPGFDGRRMITGNHLMQRAVASIHELIASHHLKRTIVVGHSLGGTITVLFAATYPHDAANIVTVEGGYPVATTQAGRDAYVKRSTAAYASLEQPQLAAALRANMLQYTITRKADVDRATALAGPSEPAAIVAWMKAALSLDLTPRLSAIKVPFSVIIPYDAQIDPYQGFDAADDKLAAYRVWAAHARKGHVTLIKGSRHFVMIDQPSAFETALEAAIAQ